MSYDNPDPRIETAAKAAWAREYGERPWNSSGMEEGGFLSVMHVGFAAADAVDPLRAALRGDLPADSEIEQLRAQLEEAKIRQDVNDTAWLYSLQEKSRECADNYDRVHVATAQARHWKKEAERLAAMGRAVQAAVQTAAFTILGDLFQSGALYSINDANEINVIAACIAAAVFGDLPTPNRD